MIGLYGLGLGKGSKPYAIKFLQLEIKFLRGYKNNSNNNDDNDDDDDDDDDNNNNNTNEFLNYNYRDLLLIHLKFYDN